MIDYCAACMKPLKPAPLGGRYACLHPQNFMRALQGAYLTEAGPPEPPHDPCARVRKAEPTRVLYFYGGA